MLFLTSWDFLLCCTDGSIVVNIRRLTTHALLPVSQGAAGKQAEHVLLPQICLKCQNVYSCHPVQVFRWTLPDSVGLLAAQLRRFVTCMASTTV